MFPKISFTKTGRAGWAGATGTVCQPWIYKTGNIHRAPTTPPASCDKFGNLDPNGLISSIFILWDRKNRYIKVLQNRKLQGGRGACSLLTSPSPVSQTVSVITSPLSISEHLSAPLKVFSRFSFLTVVVTYDVGDSAHDSDRDSSSREQFVFTSHVCVRHCSKHFAGTN